MTLNGVMAVTLRYFTEFGKLALLKKICGVIYARVYCILVRVQCRRKESSRSLSHLLMSFLFKDTSTFVGHFSQLGLYLLSYRGSGFSWKFYHRCTLGQQSPQIFLGGRTRSLTALVYTVVNKYNKYKNLISSQYSHNQAIWLENWGKLYNRQSKMQY